MRYIRTTNNYIELIETNNEGAAISTNGFRFGELYFRIKNNKVTFYLNDQENPWRNDVWTCGIPITIDGVEYATEDEASVILNKIMIPKPPKFKIEVVTKQTLENYYTKDETDDLLDDKTDKELFDAEVLIRETSDIALSGAIDTKLDTSAFTEYSGVTEERFQEIENNIYNISGDVNTISGDVIDLSDALQREIERATSAETELNQAIKDEESRAKVEELALSERILEEIDNRKAADEVLQNEIDGLDDRLQQEIDRSTREDVKHDTLISGLTDDLAAEIARATAEENRIDDKLDQEIADRIADVNAEEARATSAETVITNNLNQEITNRISGDTILQNQIDNLDDRLQQEIDRSTSKDASHDVSIANLTTNLQNEIQRAEGAENSLKNDLNSEITRATSAETVITNNLNKEIADRKAEAVASGEYNKANKKIYLRNKNGIALSTIDVTDFVKDGMVDTVSISGSNLVITFNTDSGKEPISIPLTDIFNPSNYYTKSEINSKVNTINNNITNVDNKFDNYYTKTETNNSFQTKGNYVSASTYNSYTSTTNTAITNLQNNKLDVSAYTPTDLSNYYNKTEVDNKFQEKGNYVSASTYNSYTSATNTSIANLQNDKQDKLTAGRAIDITSNVVSFTLPVSAGTGANAILEGFATASNGRASHAEGNVTKAVGNYSHAEGFATTASGDTSHAEGGGTFANGENSHSEGLGTIANNTAEHASGKYNVSNTGTTDAAKTLFSVGNGTAENIRHNAIDVRTNGDIYISSGGTSTSPMIKLQDYLGDTTYSAGDNISISSNNVISAIDTKYTAGNNVQISSSNVISATDTKYTAGDGINISSSNVISSVTKFWCGTLSEYDAITTKDANTIYLIHE